MNPTPKKNIEVGKDIFNMYLKANGYSISHFDHMYTWTPDWAYSDIIEYESATECDLLDSTVYSSWPWKNKENPWKDLEFLGQKRVGTLYIWNLDKYDRYI
jgi:hypothetical protein